MQTKLSIIIITALLLFGSCKPNTKKENSANTVSKEELIEHAKEAYIFTYPSVMMYRSMYLQALDPQKGVGLGNWLHLGISTPEDHTIVTPNNDTPYSYAWVDVSAEPYVLTLPKIEANRFYTSQWDDMYGYVLDNAGSVYDGNNGVTVLLASPRYEGAIPEGIDRVIKGESDLLGTLTRTQLIGLADLPNVKRIQQEYKLQPLSDYLGTAAPAKTTTKDWITWQEGSEKTLDFWKYGSFVSQFLNINPLDKDKWNDLAAFGFEPGKDWDISMLNAEQKEALQEGQKQAWDYLNNLASKPFDPKKFFNSRAEMEKLGAAQYDQRALGVFVGIFGNSKDISVYYAFQNDVNGHAIDASKSNYTLHFDQGKLPKVKNFWSITMYSLPQRWLVPNKIQRYSIGSASPEMKQNKDGSLTIYMQPENPSKDKEGNWLPSPDGPFWIVLRCYGPDKSIIDGTWPTPQLVPTSK